MILMFTTLFLSECNHWESGQSIKEAGDVYNEPPNTLEWALVKAFFPRAVPLSMATSASLLQL